MLVRLFGVFLDHNSSLKEVRAGIYKGTEAKIMKKCW